MSDESDRNFKFQVSKEGWEREGLSSGYKVPVVLCVYVVGWCVFVECVLFVCPFCVFSSSVRLFFVSFFVVFSDVNHFFSVCHVQEVIPITFLFFAPNQRSDFIHFMKNVIEKSDRKKRSKKVIQKSD